MDNNLENKNNNNNNSKSSDPGSSRSISDPSLSEEERLLNPPKIDEKVKRPISGDFAAIKSYKSKLRKARFFVEKTKLLLLLYSLLNIEIIFGQQKY